MDSSNIVEMNRLVGEAHVERIRMTQFRWCLHILSSLEVNLKLLKVMVCRWVGHDASFKVSQQLVSFTDFDVFICLGLEIRGLDIPFDQSVVVLLCVKFVKLQYEEAACGNDEEGGGGAHEAPAGGGDEEADGGGDEEADGGFNEEAAGGAAEDPAHEDDKVSTSHHPSVCIEIDDDGDDDEGEVPLAIPPLRSYVGDPTSTVDVDKLYYAASVVLFATTIFMHFEERSYGVVKRILFSPLYGKEFLGIRKKYVLDWILNNENIRRMEALADYGLL
ncbi:hypothetical protein LR48_Vigan10g186800 [Vigna angularis]|uniref:Uncharacterized protein n=1 Tax=Phaseolus angularis TaxID=3914 RepID=A0A0L9VLR0_PHAAN|nr:hypothetical protein LR48_Vigan10g186800 [Vigna angularis]